MDAAIDIIQIQSGSQFDPSCVAAFIDSLNEVIDIQQRSQDENQLIYHKCGKLVDFHSFVVLRGKMRI